jgi:hypothetical protein
MTLDLREKIVRHTFGSPELLDAVEEALDMWPLELVDTVLDERERIHRTNWDGSISRDCVGRQRDVEMAYALALPVCRSSNRPGWYVEVIRKHILVA